jgi:hypothetical protein
MHARSLRLAATLFLVCLLAFSPAGAVLKHDTAEIVLNSTATFDGISGTPNPFTTVTLTLSVTAPDGRTFQVDGFFDGNGNGGAVGKVFKARIYLDQEGTWNWTSTSATAGLGGQSGQVVCSGLLAGTFGKGPLIVRGPRPRYYAYADGTPVFLQGKMLDFQGLPLQRTTLIFFSHVLTDADRRASLDYQHSLATNKMGIYLYNANDFDGTEPTSPWVGSCPDSCDRTRFDLAHWKTFDTWTKTLRDEGMLAELWFFADGSGVGGFSIADRQRLIRYGMARLSGYVNTMFLVSSEWEEAFNSTELTLCAEHLQAFNPWRRPSTTHCLPGNFDFPEALWADYMSIQLGITAGWNQNHVATLATRALAVKPTLSEEFAQGFESGFSRIKAWSVLVAGPAGIGTGAYLPQIASFMSQVPFYKMQPADDLVLVAPTSNAYCMAERGYHYVCYLPLGGTFTLDLTGVTGTFEAQWYYAQYGTWTSAGTVTGGGTPSFVGPFSDDDAVLYLRPLVTGTTPPPRVTGLGFLARADLDWEDTTAAASYDLVHGDLGLLRAQNSFTASVNGCIENNGADRRASHATLPAPGQAFWYLTRATRSNGIAGPYGMSEPRERPGRDAEIAASAGRCP